MSRQIQRLAPTIIIDYTGEKAPLKGENLVCKENHIIKLITNNRKYPLLCLWGDGGTKKVPPSSVCESSTHIVEPESQEEGHSQRNPLWRTFCKTMGVHYSKLSVSVKTKTKNEKQNKTNEKKSSNCYTLKKLKNQDKECNPVPWLDPIFIKTDIKVIIMSLGEICIWTIYYWL